MNLARLLMNCAQVITFLQKPSFRSLKPDQIEHVANRIHALIRLHARELESEADRMASRAKWVSDLYQKINISLSAFSP